ncbi:uncharacterized protein FSUBG_8842 [Fusarium subglutinans]|uniref:Uncharacterized protein n=1 Tax=Gibberella subglutinans TaxID=42677 RepID=A0A8H5UT98_GIBSU|nr:uncharacterized protein FSUBG_8842 [Fusarium subglutinans]KAF5596540.1 hypothetical protein FSUBG_8842 [Fusarium subglutinans]
MNQPQSPPSQASSHFQLEPIPAAILVDRELKRRDAIALLGACKTGCEVIDEEVMLGGFERGSVVGISAEDEELGVQLGLQILAHSLCEGTVTSGLLITPRPASVMLAGLRDTVKSELEAKRCTKDTIRMKLRQCLEKVMLSCVFDMDGLWEALADLDCEVVEEKDGAVQEQEVTNTTRYQYDEIQDSQDDDDVAFSPIQQASQPVAEEPCNTTQQHPDVIVITHFSSLLTGLFFHREKSAAHAALQLLSSHLRDLSRNLSSKPLILLLNSTSAVSSGPALATATAASPAKQSQVDPTLRSIFNPPPLNGYSARRTKPNFGLIFTQLLDLHLLCTKIPKTRRDAEGAVRQLPGDEIELVWVVEVLLDELGVWEGHTGARSGREQRWAAVKVEKGRIGQAIDEKEPEAKIPDISDLYEVQIWAGLRCPDGFGDTNYVTTWLCEQARPPYFRRTANQSYLDRKTTLLKPHRHRGLTLKLHDLSRGAIAKAFPTKMPSSCKELREALAQCLQESDCVMVERNSAADCLREPLVNTLPLKCRQLKKGFGECKRGMVDMRKRFRGNMPVAYRTMEQAEEGQGYQLYAGRPAFAGGVKKTDGNEPIPQDWREVENEKWKAEQAAMEQQKK